MAVLTFYDIDNKRKQGWSPNTLKTEYALKHKGLKEGDYELKWISYPDIRELLKSKGVQPAEGTRVQQYTLPAIDHDGKTIMDSLKIALYLDEKFPDAPRLIPEGTLPLYRALQSYTALSITTHVFPLLLPRVIAFLDDRGAEYFRRTREEAVGYTITDAINQNEAKVNECWEKATAGLKMVNQMLDDNPGGPYILGKERSYADMHLVSFLEWWKQCGDDIYERGVSIAPNLKRLYEACSDLNE